MESFLSNNIKLTDKEYAMFVDLIYKTSGINLGNNKQDLLRTRFQKIVRRLDVKSYSDYYDYVVNDKGGSAFSEMIDAISTNHTFFFREKDHFQFLQSKSLPSILQKKNLTRSKRMRIWCAAASSGEEPYTIMISLLEAMNTANWDVKMLATDISTKILKKAIDGKYKRQQIKEVAPLLIDKYFDWELIEKEKIFTIKPALKSLISFRKFNLMTTKFPFKGKFDFIFCRNVMIYFDLETQQTLVNKMIDYLEDDGYLFIGHSENISGAVRNRLKPLAPAVFQKV